MISRQSVEVFVKYDGDSDAFERVATPEEQALLPSSVVMGIEDIIIHLSLSRAGAVSTSYTAETAELVSSRNIEPSALVILTNFVAHAHVYRGARA